jgi:hypothetical protein
MGILWFLTISTWIKIASIVFGVFSLGLVVRVKCLLCLMGSTLSFISVSIWPSWFHIIYISLLNDKTIGNRCFVLVLLILRFDCLTLGYDTLLQLSLFNWIIGHRSMIIIGWLLDLPTFFIKLFILSFIRFTLTFLKLI